MRCVDCEVDMLLVTISGVQLDVCPSCKGVWFDAGELERCVKFSPKQIKSNFGEAVIIPKAEGLMGPQRACPRCARNMDKERFKGGVWIDKCPNGDGVWLDEAEIVLVRSELEASKMGKLDAAQGGSLSEQLKSMLAAFFSPLTR